ncbi:MAG TPA: thioesterase domain-containing protein [Tepidisphaeraceae bacterium]|nr:thioesterase domain-containing protein [Tepidisphaeraceae bacterium]
MSLMETKLMGDHVSRKACDIRDWIVAELAKSTNVALSEIDATAPLLSLGIDSLAAIGLSGGLASYLGRDVPATLMWDYESIDAIARALAEQPIAPSKPRLPQGVVELQPPGRRPPIFCFPGLGGEGEDFALLARDLGPAQACYGLTIPQSDEQAHSLSTIKQMASIMAARLCEVQPNGPYQLVGYSLGGLLAFEAADQLTAAGKSVSMLAIFDTFTPAGKTLRPRWQRLFLHAWFLATQKDRLQQWYDLMENRLEARQPALNARTIGQSEFISRCRQASAHYQPRAYPGSITLFRATERSPQSAFFKLDESNGWRKVAQGGIRIINVPGGHTSLIDSAHAPTSAAALLAELERQSR